MFALKHAGWVISVVSMSWDATAVQSQGVFAIGQKIES